jgi:hypothetical protein
MSVLMLLSMDAVDVHAASRSLVQGLEGCMLRTRHAWLMCMLTVVPCFAWLVPSTTHAPYKLLASCSLAASEASMTASVKASHSKACAGSVAMEMERGAGDCVMCVLLVTAPL